MDVVGYEGIYEVSDKGRIRSHKNKTTFSRFHGKRKWKQRTLKQKVSKDGNHRVSLWKDGKETTCLVHRIVAYAFHEKIEGKDYVNHIDGDRYNNSSENLEWCNHKENNNHAFDTGLMTTNKPTILENKETGEIFYFRSMSKASQYLGKNKGFISASLGKGVNEVGEYVIRIKGVEEASI